jgi:Rrf2 family protein
MISEIAKAYNMPQQFLAKIAQTLVKQQLLIAIRGRNGGVKLAKDPKDIFLDKIVYAVDGPPPEKEQCVIGIDDCSDLAPCPLHHRWKVIREDIREMLVSENLDDLAKRVIEKRYEMLNQ